MTEPPVLTAVALTELMDSAIEEACACARSRRGADRRGRRHRWRDRRARIQSADSSR